MSRPKPPIPMCPVCFELPILKHVPYTYRIKTCGKVSCEEVQLLRETRDDAFDANKKIEQRVVGVF